MNKLRKIFCLYLPLCSITILWTILYSLNYVSFLKFIIGCFIIDIIYFIYKDYFFIKRFIDVKIDIKEIKEIYK